MLEFCSFSSGSSGNCYLVKTEQTALLVDAGIPLKRIREGLSRTATPEETVAAVLITHEHSDHIRALSALAGPRGLRRGTSGGASQGSAETPCGGPAAEPVCRETATEPVCGGAKEPAEPLAFYANRETWEAIGRLPLFAGSALPGKRECRYGEPFSVGDITVRPFRLSHDAAAAMGYSLSAGSSRITIITDTGVITEEIRDIARASDLLVLEANHDVDMLRIGRYPWFLKQRILGDRGHLSNDTAAELVCALLREGTAPRTVALAHLSKENNFPEMAWQTLANAVEEAGFVIGRDIEVRILVRDTISEVFRA